MMLNSIYQYQLQRLLKGAPREARGLKYYESPYVPHVQPMTVSGANLVTLKARKLNYRFALIERLSYLSGLGHYPLRIVSYVPNYRNFVTPEFIDRGAYGPRISCQVRRIYELLKDDPMTRQAVVNIHNYLQDNRGDVKDVPCTLALNFHGDEKTLNCVGYMRSNDIVWGWPYDVSAFMFLLQVMSFWLGREVGTYTHVATSLHLYDNHVELAREVAKAEAEDVFTELDDLPPWDLSYEDTWPALEKFWQLEEMLRTGCRGIHEGDKLTGSAHLDFILRYLSC